MKLIIGNKRYSSWSLRPWLLMKEFGIPFEEILIPLDQPKTTEQILKYSPSGKVPALIDGDVVVWESMAIAEYLNEKYPEKKMWPTDRASRAHARAIANEMHGGFQLLRTHLSHDLQKSLTNFDSSPARADIDRILAIWREALKKSGGPFLFGNFTIADAMYAPVVNRFISYGVKVDQECTLYMQKIRGLPSHEEWIAAAKAETLSMPRYDGK